MKKLLFTLVMVFSAIFVQAQNEHLKFKGIPIAGDLNTFVGELKKQGFTHLEDEELSPNTAALEGVFTGRNVHILVGANSKNKDVWKVLVIFDDTKDWENLSEEYFSYKDLFTTKYGKPSFDIEKIEDDYAAKYKMEMYALSQNKVNYNTVFELVNGYIRIAIEPYGIVGGCIVIHYEDKINSYKRTQNKLDDI